MKIPVQQFLRNRYYVNGITLFVLLCFVIQCNLQIMSFRQWNAEMNHSIEQYGKVIVKAPKTYSYLSAIHVLPNFNFSFGFEWENLSLLVEGLLFFILLCGLLSNFIQKKNVAIIRGFMGIIFMEKLVALIMVIWSLLNTPPDTGKHPEIIGILTWYLFFALLFMGLSWLVILYYKQTRDAEHEVYETDGVKTISLIPSSHGHRFLNYLLDSLILTIIMAKHIYFAAERLQGSNSPWPIAGLLLLTIFLYYFLTELWFSATPGKMFSSCRVIDQHGEEPGFFKVLVRTLCRFIPFDRFSFFFNANWHDKLSETWVVGDVERGDREGVSV